MKIGAWVVVALIGSGAVAAVACGNSSTPDQPDSGGVTEPDAASAGDDATIADSGTGAADAPSEADGDAGATPDASTTCVLDGGAVGTICGASGCVDTTSDPANCGGCGAGCEAGAVCGSGSCQNVAGSLAGLRWELPCTSASNGTSCATEVDGSVEEVLTTTLSGTTGQTYDVTLHFRGVVEQRTYTGYDAGGAIGAEPEGGVNPGFFIAGGPAPSTSDTFNIYELDISSPPQTYFLNSGASGINYVWLIDYLATVPMSAGATVTLTANSVEGQEISNQGTDGGPVYVPVVPPAPQAFNGQFVQMDVTAVVPTP